MIMISLRVVPIDWSTAIFHLLSSFRFICTLYDSQVLFNSLSVFLSGLSRRFLLSALLSSFNNRPFHIYNLSFRLFTTRPKQRSFRYFLSVFFHRSLYSSDLCLRFFITLLFKRFFFALLAFLSKFCTRGYTPHVGHQQIFF